MRANLIVHTDPFRTHLNATTCVIPESKSISNVLFDLGLCTHAKDGSITRVKCFVVFLNGVDVLQKDWNTIICDDDVLQIVHVPRGGGGSNLKTILAAIIIAVLAYFTFGLSLAAAAAVGVAAYAGLTIIGAQVPLPSSSTGNLSRESTSPTYSNNAQTNSARLFEAIPRIYGRVKMVPDLAAQPYVEFQGNQQYLYQLFSVSLGRVQIEQILIDDTDIESFEDATIQIINPGEAVTLFPDNVDTSDAVNGLEMLGPNNPAYVTLGPYVVGGPQTKTNAIGIDLSMPRGAGTIDDNGNTQGRLVSFAFERQEVNDLGAPIGTWQVLLNTNVSFATSQPQVFSYKIEVPEGRYQIRARRTSEEAADTRTFDTLQWVSLRAYLQSHFVYPDTTLIAVVMRATNALNSTTARKFSVIATGMVQKWNPIDGFGELVPDNSIAWAAADILRNQVYGRGLTDDRYNLTELYRLSTVWEDRGDSFNGVFDTTTQLWDALSKVCRAGRTVPIYYAGVIDFIRDEPRTIPNATFQPSNMLAGSFKTVYNFFDQDTPDHVVVEFVNEDTWLQETVVCVLPGGTQERPFNSEMFGVTNRDQAWREGISMAAANRDRRRSITFTSSTPGLVPYYNSLARISHDVPQWGYCGRVISLDTETGVLRTTEPIPFVEDVPHVIAFRKRNGSEDGPYTIILDPAANPDDNIYGCLIQATTEQLEEIYVSDGVREDYTFYQCGPTERQGMLVLISSAMPTSDGNVNVSCINYADSVYSAETGGVVPPPPPESNLPTIPTAPIVSRVDVFYTTEVNKQNVVATPANGSIYYEFQAREEAAVDWIALGTNADPSLIVHLSPGPWRVRVRAIGRAVGPWATWIGTIEATTIPTPTLDTFVAASQLFSIGLTWSYAAVSRSIAGRIEVYASGSNVFGSAVKLVDLPYPANSFTHSNLSAGQEVWYWARVIDTSGRAGNFFNGGAGTHGQASSDATKILDALTDQITASQLATELLEEIASGGDATVAVNALITQLAAMYTIKTQLTVDGQPYMAAIGVGVENDEGIITSQILLSAQRVAILEEIGGEITVPFLVSGGQVFINSAVIGDASIGSAKFSDWLESDAVNDDGVPTIRLNFRTGVLEFNGVAGSPGNLLIDNQLITVVGASGNTLVEMGVLPP